MLPSNLKTLLIILWVFIIFIEKSIFSPFFLYCCSFEDITSTHLPIQSLLLLSFPSVFAFQHVHIRCVMLFDFIFTGIHIVTWIYRLLSFIDFGIFSAIIPSIYCYFHTVSPPPTPITYDEHDDCVPRITFAFPLFSNLLSFWNSVWIFSIWSLFQFTHLPSAACTVRLSSCWFQLLNFFIFKIFLITFYQIPIFWWNYPSSHLFSLFFSLFLEYIYQIYFKVFFCSFQYLIHLYDISHLALDFHHMV